MAFSFRCSQCGHVHTMSEHWAGKVIKCEGCGKATRIPIPPEAKATLESAKAPGTPTNVKVFLRVSGWFLLFVLLSCIPLYQMIHAFRISREQRAAKNGANVAPTTPVTPPFRGPWSMPVLPGP